jgi:phosphatidylglycerophosphatase C
VAAFDFDGTLTDGGSVWRFLSALRGRPRVLAAGVALAPLMVRAALFGGPASDVAKEALFRRTLAGLDAADVTARAATFGRAHYARRARIEMRARLDWHQRQGHRIVIVSASPEYYVKPVGEDLGVDGVVATRLEVDADGRLTGRFEGANCRAEQKRDRLEQWLEASQRRASDGVGARVGDAARAEGERPFVWAYGNSAGDRAMLEAADIGVDAGRLGRWGKLRGFRRIGDVLTAW